MADPVYCSSHETVCTGMIEKDESQNILYFLIRFRSQSQLTEILWDWYYEVKTYFGSSSGSCSSSYSIHWSSRLCTVLLITGVSAFMLLIKSFWYLTVLRYVSRCISYCDLCIEIRIVSWGTRIVTPLVEELATCISSTLAAMRLAAKDKYILLLFWERFQVTSFQFWEMLEKANVILQFLRKIQHNNGQLILGR